MSKENNVQSLRSARKVCLVPLAVTLLVFLNITNFLQLDEYIGIRTRQVQEIPVDGMLLLKQNSGGYDDPGVKWPQKDLTIRTAIRKGTRVGSGTQENTYMDPTNNMTYYHCAQFQWNATKCQAPTKGLATIVTAYYHLRSKHSWAEYQQWMGYMMRSTDPMVIFVEPFDPAVSKHDWPAFMLERRKHAPTIVVELPFANLTMNTTFGQDFWDNEVAPTEPNQGFVKYTGTRVYQIWNEKIVMMQEVARLNPFHTEHFFWVDSGYFRKKINAPNYYPLVKNNITKNGVRRDQVLFQNIFEPEYEIAGGAWGGTAQAIDRAYDRYWQTFWWMAVHRYDCIGYEQRVMVMMCKSFPSFCSIHMSKWDKDWFAMGTQWLRDPAHDWRIPYPFLHNETNLVGPIPFPSEPVIHAVDRPDNSTVAMY